MSPVIAVPLILAFGAVLIAAGWVALYLLLPAVPALVHDLLAYAPMATGVWLALAVIGIDYAATAARNAIGYRNVGAKSRAHYSLGGRGQ